MNSTRTPGALPRGGPDRGPLDALAAAIAYTKLGWAVVPARGKVPVAPRGFLDASTDPDVLRKLWGSATHYGVSLATGEMSGVWALDVDGEVGAAALSALTERHGRLPDTVTSRSGGGGWHLFFRMPEEGGLGSPTGKVGDNLDVRASGASIVLPPSRHPSGRQYAWLKGKSPYEAEVATAPAWLIEEVRKVIPDSAPAAHLWKMVPERPAGERERVVSALAHVSPALSYDEWIRVGMALHDHDPGVGGFSLWRDWSAQDQDNYPGEGKLLTHWKSFGTGAVSVGTLFHLAKCAGWVAPCHPTADLRALLRPIRRGGAR